MQLWSVVQDRIGPSSNTIPKRVRFSKEIDIDQFRLDHKTPSLFT